RQLCRLRQYPRSSPRRHWVVNFDADEQAAPTFGKQRLTTQEAAPIEICQPLDMAWAHHERIAKDGDRQLKLAAIQMPSAVGEKQIEAIRVSDVNDTLVPRHHRQLHE